MGSTMDSFFGLPNNDYSADTLIFVLSVVFLALPLAALIAASLLEGPMRQRAGRHRLAPAPLSLRRPSGAWTAKFACDTGSDRTGSYRVTADPRSPYFA